MTRVAEALNLFYHGLKESEKPEMFQDVRRWLAEMEPQPEEDLMLTRMRVECELRYEVALGRLMEQGMSEQHAIAQLKQEGY